jgi:endogenous inhibitor of DNA gyrase (YacG/DUF329 family)
VNDRACPICGKSLAPSATASEPFCSERCRNIDLGRWLSERYRIAADSPPDADAELDETIAEYPAELRRS